MTGYPQTLAAAVEVLRGLPRHRDAVPDARRTVAAWRTANPGCRAQLVVDERPGTPLVDYDLLIDHPDGGTVALTASAEDGVPWTVDHSTHWAASKVLRVDGVDLSVQTALLSMRAYGERNRALHDDLIDYCILSLETWEDEEPSEDELQRASDDFRRRRGLHSRADTMRWLDQVGLTPEAYQNHLFALARMNRFTRRTQAESATAYFTDHAADFDRVSAVWAIGPEAVLGELAGQNDTIAALGAAVTRADGDLTVQVADRVAAELPEPLRGAAEGMTVGPVAYRDAFLFGAVRRRRPAQPDDATLAAAGRAAFSAFMAERRAKAKIEWFWL
ncbi:TIGR04500 family putative peptide maturation system protein [Streptosporangium sp. NPDC000509]|uniref:TIGR04500 family putative peptide maturation system protein n=1 Tax=Streptosporangium sp. NPDC000509 TaxID=3366186 RepID=UPI0036A57C91